MQIDSSRLIAEFSVDGELPCELTPVSPEEMPEVARKLLNHNHHMTVTVEQHHDSRVDVEVLQYRIRDGIYSREIILRRQSDSRPVLYGIIRMRVDAIPEPVRSRILERKIPLGRILIEGDVLRRVQLETLFRVSPGNRLKEIFPEATRFFGRTAVLHVDTQPAIELLEIVVE